jgi:hypothetical protein
MRMFRRSYRVGLDLLCMSGLCSTDIFRIEEGRPAPVASINQPDISLGESPFESL